MGELYVTSVVYGVGMGAWVSTEIGSSDPALVLIPPAILGIAAPIGAYFLDRPTMREGVPSAISAGLLLGAGEGIGIAATQMVTASSEHAWGFRGLARATALGATVGGVGGWAAGTFLRPTPMTSSMAISGAAWGTAIGSMLAYGSTPGSSSYGAANDTTSIGGLVGYNLGAAASAVIGATARPSPYQLAWMWGGAGIGAAASTPVFLLYVGSDSPARRGFLFMGTATTVGIIAGGLFSGVGGGLRTAEVPTRSARKLASIDMILPIIQKDQVGVSLAGTLQ